jgi:hypothetical protein
MKKALIISIILNFILLLILGWNNLNCPSYEIGRLEKDVEIGIFMTDSTLLTLPKGLTVKNASVRGIDAIGRFENERFQIVFTSNDHTLVNYDLPEDSLQVFGNTYSVITSYD